MAEELPEELRRKLMRKWMRRLGKQGEEKRDVAENPEEIVWSRLSDEKARELFRKAKILYPARYRAAVRALAEAVKKGLLGEIDGYTALVLLHRLGMPVKPDLRIRFVKHGKEVSFKDYVGD